MWPFTSGRASSEKAIIDDVLAKLTVSREKLVESLDRQNELLTQLDGKLRSIAVDILPRLIYLTPFSDSLAEFREVCALKNEEISVHARTLKSICVNTLEVKASMQREDGLTSRQVDALRKTGGSKRN